MNDKPKRILDIIALPGFDIPKKGESFTVQLGNAGFGDATDIRTVAVLSVRNMPDGSAEIELRENGAK